MMMIHFGSLRIATEEWKYHGIWVVVGFHTFFFFQADIHDTGKVVTNLLPSTSNFNAKP